MSKKNVVLSVLVAALLLSEALEGQEIQGIIGGTGVASSPYAALISSSGSAQNISLPGMTGTGQILSVAINGFAESIVGGRFVSGMNIPYAALVSPSGIATQIPNLPSDGSILSVAINTESTGLIGGLEGSNAYAAFVSSSGILTTISPLPTGFINIVSINESNNGIIGGQDSGTSNPYAAFVSPSGSATNISLTSSGTGFIFGAAINNQGNAIVGGQDGGSATAYAALVSSSGSATTISLTGISGNGVINWVAINNQGTGIVGGQDGGLTTPYAALISPSGIATEILLTGSSGNGVINAVAINDQGTGIIGGQDGGFSTPYAALISPSAIATEIQNIPLGSGSINSVAINNEGAALIGGNVPGSVPYAALVSPSGIATTISNLPASGTIFSVANLVPILEETIPTSFGPNNSFANPLFALSTQILSNHLLALKYPNDPENLIDVAMLADASDVVDESATSNECEESICSPCCTKPTYSLWASPLLYNAHQKKQGNNPELTNWAAGAMVGFDYYGFQNAIFGAGAAYAFDYVHLFDGIGHAKIDQEFLTLYGASRWEHFYINASLWGGLYQVDNERHTVGIITSTSDYDGWLFLPHLEMSFPFYAKDCWFVIDPFLMFDWANNWQSHVHEKGSSGFNLVIGHQYTSLLRSEAGLRFFQSLQYCWGSLVIMEKASYVNKLPFHAGSSNAIFVAGTAPFGVEMFTNRTQNLGVGQFEMTFVPRKSKYPYGSINYQGEFGSTFQSHLVSFEVGKEF